MIDIRCCDNMELMKELPDNYIDLIYCDILYGTGRKFKDYQDLKPKRGIIEEHYIPRIKEMHRVLKDTGSIYLQMDTRINHWLRCIMDDIFGYDNFLNEIVWCYKTQGASKKHFSKKHDVIYLYSKTKKYIFNTQKEKSYMLHTYGFKKSDFLLDDRGQYSMVIMKDWWEVPAIGSATKEKIGYQTQKPKALIERIIKASSNEGDLVADFYMGSGTTAEVCKDLNRNFIGCDISERAVKIAKNRIENT